MSAVAARWLAPAATGGRRLRIGEDAVAAGLIGLLCLGLLLIVALPLWSLLAKSVEDEAGRFVGLANFVRYASTPTLVVSLLNSLGVAALTTAIVVPLAFLYAFALTRTRMMGKPVFYAIALVPIFAPSLLAAIALTYIFGNQGLIKGALLGHSIYGPIGIVMAEALYCFPSAVLILITSLSLADGRLYEAADALGTTKRRAFLTITLPGARYGLVSAAFVVFTLVVTDFGVPKVIGGQFNVLATDAYKQVIGQQNFPMGAVVGLIMLIPAAVAFGIDRVVRRQQKAMLTSRSVPYEPKPDPLRDRGLMLVCLVVAGLILATYGTAVWASFIRYWPYNMSLTLANYDFANTDPDGWEPYLNSLKLAACVGLIGPLVVLVGAYLVEKLRPFPLGRAFVHLVAMLPLAVPGLVLGLGYVFFFNARGNPLNVFYGTMTILVVNTLAHYYTVAHITATTALKQIDGEFEAVSASMGVPFWTTFRRVTLPICFPTLVNIGLYLATSALTTVSAVIFLYGPGTKLAAVAIVHMDEAGTQAAAAAMATLILATAMGIRIVSTLLERFVFARLQDWRLR